MIRYYESTGLIAAADRKSSGYREYDEADLHRLTFVRRARELGFSMDDIRDLLALWSDRRRSNAAVRKVALKHVASLEKRARQLQDMVGTLQTLIGTCERGERADCPIMTELSGGLEPPAATEGNAARSRPGR